MAIQSGAPITSSDDDGADADAERPGFRAGADFRTYAGTLVHDEPDRFAPVGTKQRASRPRLRNDEASVDLKVKAG